MIGLPAGNPTRERDLGWTYGETIMAGNGNMIGALLALILLLAACTTGGQNTVLAGTEWVLISLQGEDPIAGRDVTLRFEDATLEGYAGCNTYRASYDASEDSLSVGVVEATEMGCMEPAGILDQEQAYFGLVASAAGYRVDGDRLEIYDEAGEAILVLVASGGSGAMGE